MSKLTHGRKNAQKCKNYPLHPACISAKNHSTFDAFARRRGTGTEPAQYPTTHGNEISDR